MSRTRVIYLSVLAVIFLILLGIAVYYLIYSRILADSSYGTEIERQSRNWDIDSDGKKETVSIIKYSSSSKNNFILTATDDDSRNYSLGLIGFESDASFCKDNELVSINHTNVVCLSGYVGVHSENIQLIEFDGKNLKPIYFFNNESNENHIASDSPMFGFIDINGDNLAEFYVDNRDYDKDPVLDILRSYYYFIDGVFRYHNVESIYNEEQTSGDGRIN